MSQNFVKNYFLIILISLFICSCSSSPRNFKDTDLLIDQSVMPANWILIDTDSSVEPEGQNSGAYITFQYENTPYNIRGREKVFRYSDNVSAAWHYKRLESYYFNNDSVHFSTPWESPDGFEFSSSLAKQSRFACAEDFGTSDNQISGKFCSYLAQYDEFLVFFSITRELKETSAITIEQITSIISSIDEKMNINLKP